VVISKIRASTLIVLPRSQTSNMGKVHGRYSTGQRPPPA
jgi:hypothetical protein